MMSMIANKNWLDLCIGSTRPRLVLAIRFLFYETCSVRCCYDRSSSPLEEQEGMLTPTASAILK